MFDSRPARKVRAYRLNIHAERRNRGGRFGALWSARPKRCALL
jgi:hypothetical protein